MADVTIPREVLERYAEGVREIADAGRRTLASTLPSIDLANRDAVLDLMSGACRAADQAAAQYSAQFYRGLSILQTGQDFRAEAVSSHDAKALEVALKGIYRQATGDDGELDEELLGRLLEDRLAYEVSRTSKHGVWANGQRDGRDVRYARVPVGIETCAWCLMTAGLGYWYMTEEAASHTHAHCVVGDTRVSGSGLLAGMRREYEGVLVHIVTAGGRELTVTPEHPILTARGWVLAGGIVNGDHLVCTTLDHGNYGGVPDVDDVPPTAEELFEAAGLVDAALSEGMPVPAKHLYGEMFPDCDVHVVSPDGLLERAAKATVGEPSKHHRLAFAGGDEAISGTLLKPDGTANLLLDGDDPSTDCVMGRSRLSRPLLGGHARSADNASLGGTAMLDASVPDPAVDNVAADAKAACDGVDALSALIRFERVGISGDALLANLDALALDGSKDGGPVDADTLGDFIRADARQIELDDVVSLSVSEGSCHVYNLSTRGGWYVSSGIITHNCDCAIVASIGRGDCRIDGYDSTTYRDMWRDANKALRNGDVPTELSQRVDFLSATRPGYRTDTNGALAVMRWKYGLK